MLKEVELFWWVNTCEYFPTQAEQNSGKSSVFCILRVQHLNISISSNLRPFEPTNSNQAIFVCSNGFTNTSSVKQEQRIEHSPVVGSTQAWIIKMSRIQCLWPAVYEIKIRTTLARYWHLWTECLQERASFSSISRPLMMHKQQFEKMHCTLAICHLLSSAIKAATQVLKLFQCYNQITYNNHCMKLNFRNRFLISLVLTP